MRVISLERPGLLAAKTAAQAVQRGRPCLHTLTELVHEFLIAEPRNSKPTVLAGEVDLTDLISLCLHCLLAITTECGSLSKWVLGLLALGQLKLRMCVCYNL